MGLGAQCKFTGHTWWWTVTGQPLSPGVSCGRAPLPPSALSCCLCCAVASEKALPCLLSAQLVLGPTSLLSGHCNVIALWGVTLCPLWRGADYPPSLLRQTKLCSSWH